MYYKAKDIYIGIKGQNNENLGDEINVKKRSRIDQMTQKGYVLCAMSQGVDKNRHLML